ncbi:hypothetical protein ACLOJK_022366 [Asimina triloba]
MVKVMIYESEISASLVVSEGELRMIERSKREIAAAVGRRNPRSVPSQKFSVQFSIFGEPRQRAQAGARAESLGRGPRRVARYRQVRDAGNDSLRRDTVMTSRQNFPESNQGKGKAPNTSGEAEAARSHARRAPANADKLDQVIERVSESSMAQEAIRLELVTKLESLQKVVANVEAFVMKLEEKQTSQDAEMTFSRRKLEAMQIQPTKTPSTPLGKRKAKTFTDEEGPNESPLAPESFDETSSTIPNPPPLILEKTISSVNVEQSSPVTPRAPLAEPTFVKVPPQF